jgi:hypothetical protein
VSESGVGHDEGVAYILFVGGAEGKFILASFGCPVFEVKIMRLPGALVKGPTYDHYIPFAISFKTMKTHLRIVAEGPKRCNS